MRASLVREGKINPSRYFKDGRNPTSRHAAVSCAAAGNVFALHAGRHSLCRTYGLRLEDKGWLTCVGLLCVPVVGQVGRLPVVSARSLAPGRKVYVLKFLAFLSLIQGVIVWCGSTLF